jgi:hypothetical protein
MPKIEEVVNKSRLAPLQQKVLTYLAKHSDEVYGYDDSRTLSKAIEHNGSERGVAFSLWALDRKGLIDKERIGRLVYFGSKDAIAELRKRRAKKNP